VSSEGGGVHGDDVTRCGEGIMSLDEEDNVIKCRRITSLSVGRGLTSVSTENDVTRCGE